MGSGETGKRAAVPITCPRRCSPPLRTRLRLWLCLRLGVPGLPAAGRAMGPGVGSPAAVVS